MILVELRCRKQDIAPAFCIIGAADSGVHKRARPGSSGANTVRSLFNGLAVGAAFPAVNSDFPASNSVHRTFFNVILSRFFQACERKWCECHRR